MSKTKISDIRYYSVKTPVIEYEANDNLLGEWCSEMIIFLMSLILFGPLVLVVLLAWIISNTYYFLQCTFDCIFVKNKQTQRENGIALTFEEARWVKELNNSMVGVMFMDRALDITELKSIISEKLLDFENKPNRNSHISRRFHQVAVSRNNKWHWVEDIDFNLDNHIATWYAETKDLSDILVDITNKPYSFSHPLWNLFLLDSCISIDNSNMNMEEHTANCETIIPNSTIILKIHPGMADGISLMKILTELLNDKPQTLPLKSNNQRLNFCCHFLNVVFYSTYLFLKSWTFQKSRRNIFSSSMNENENVHPNDSPDNEFLFCNFSLKEITKLKLITRSTFGEIVLSVLSSSIKHHHHILSKTINIEDSPCLLTIDMSKNSHRQNRIQKVRNNLSFCEIELPLGTEGILPILWTVKQRMKSMKSSSDYIFLYLFPKVLSSIFTSETTIKLMEYYYRKSKIVLSSINGTWEPVTINENKSKHILCWFPIFGLISISIACFSYNDKFTICLRGKNSKFVNLQILLNAIKFQIQHLAKLLENRCVPGEKVHSIKPDNYIIGLDQRLPVSSLTTTQILDMLNDIQIKIRTERHHSEEEIEEMKLNFSTLFAILKERKKNGTTLFQNSHDPKYLIDRRFSLPTINNVLRKDSVRRLSFSKRDVKVTEVFSKMSEDKQVGGLNEV